MRASCLIAVLALGCQPPPEALSTVALQGDVFYLARADNEGRVKSIVLPEPRARGRLARELQLDSSGDRVLFFGLLEGTLSPENFPGAILVAVDDPGLPEDANLIELPSELQIYTYQAGMSEITLATNALAASVRSQLRLQVEFGGESCRFEERQNLRAFGRTTSIYPSGGGDRIRSLVMLDDNRAAASAEGKLLLVRRGEDFIEDLTSDLPNRVQTVDQIYRDPTPRPDGATRIISRHPFRLKDVLAHEGGFDPVRTSTTIDADDLPDLWSNEDFQWNYAIVDSQGTTIVVGSEGWGFVHDETRGARLFQIPTEIYLGNPAPLSRVIEVPLPDTPHLIVSRARLFLGDARTGEFTEIESELISGGDFTPTAMALIEDEQGFEVWVGGIDLNRTQLYRWRPGESVERVRLDLPMELDPCLSTERDSLLGDLRGMAISGRFIYALTECQVVLRIDRRTGCSAPIYLREDLVPFAGGIKGREVHLLNGRIYVAGDEGLLAEYDVQ